MGTACDDASATPISTSSSPVSSTPNSQPAIMRGLIIIAFCATLVALAWTEDREHGRGPGPRPVHSRRHRRRRLRRVLCGRRGGPLHERVRAEGILSPWTPPPHAAHRRGELQEDGFLSVARLDLGSRTSDLGQDLDTKANTEDNILFHFTCE